MPVIRVYTGPSTYKELDLDDYYVKNTNFKLNQLTDVSFQNLSGGQMMIYTPEGGGKWVNFTPNFASGSHTHSADDINSGTLASARIPNLSASKITSGTLSTDVLPDIPFSKITTLGGNDFLMSTPDGGLTFVSTVPFDRLPIGSGSNEVAIGNHKHSASEITSGTLNSARIPNLSASKITSGTLSADRLPSIPFNLLPVGTAANTVARGSHTHSTLSDLIIDGILEIRPPGGGGHLPMLQLDAVTGLQFVGRHIPDTGLYASNYALLAPVNDTSIQNNVLILPNGSGTLARLSDVPDTTDFADAEHEHDFNDIKDIRWGNKDLDAVLNDVYEFASGRAPRNHTHSADDINSGTLASARIPNLSASKITSGTLSADRLPSIPFNLLPVGTTSSTVARGNHNHLLSHLSDIAFTNLSGGQMMIYTPEGGGKWVNFTPNFASGSHTHDNYYTKTEIDTMIGDIETLLEGI